MGRIVNIDEHISTIEENQRMLISRYAKVELNSDEILEANDKIRALQSLVTELQAQVDRLTTQYDSLHGDVDAMSYDE
jgi:peptidoglycan hydrolase CwlO-like protein